MRLDGPAVVFSGQGPLLLEHSYGSAWASRLLLILRAADNARLGEGWGERFAMGLTDSLRGRGAPGSR